MSILPPFPGFFFLISDDLGFSAEESGQGEDCLEQRIGRTVSGLVGLHSFVKHFGFTFVREDESNHAFLPQEVSLVHKGHRRMPHVTGEGVEVRPVLKVVEVLVEFMLPYDAPRPVQIDEFKLSSSLRILCEREATL